MCKRRNGSKPRRTETEGKRTEEAGESLWRGLGIQLCGWIGLIPSASRDTPRGLIVPASRQKKALSTRALGARASTRLSAPCPYSPRRSRSLSPPSREGVPHGVQTFLTTSFFLPYPRPTRANAALDTAHELILRRVAALLFQALMTVRSK